jgi:photosystem II stability/assembly factor-like uncharacterized protein
MADGGIDMAFERNTRWCAFAACVSLGVSFLAARALPLAAAEPAGEPQGRREAFEDRAGRERWFLEQRALPGRSVPTHLLAEALERAAECRVPEDASPAWESLGPAPVRNVSMQGDGGMTYSGRSLAVALDPRDSRTILLGAAQGGIWRSEDGGAHFAPVADGMPSLAIKVIRFAPSNPDVVYAGSGEPHSKTSLFGMGVFKSTDGGRNWQALPPAGSGWDFRYLAVSGLQVDSTDARVLYVTTANVLPDRVDAFHPPPWAAEPGIFKSTDGGQTWVRKLTAHDYRPYDFPAYDPYLASGYGFMDLELYRKSPQVLFAVERSGGIYRTTDGGEHWSLVTPVKNPGAGAAQGADFPAALPRWAYLNSNTWVFQNYPVIGRSPTTPEFNRVEIAIGQDGAGLTSDYRTVPIYAGYGTILQLDTNGDGVFNPAVDLSAPTALIFKSSDGGDTWHWLGDWQSTGAPAYCDTYSDPSMMNALYDNMVEVNPLDADDVVVGGNANYSTYWPDPLVNPTRLLTIPWRGFVYRSLDGGRSWMDTTQACSGYVPDLTKPPIGGLPVYKCMGTPSSKTVHPDLHCAFFDTPHHRLYVTCDGGLWGCSIAGDGRDGLNDYAWEPLNEDLSTLQFFDLGSHPSDPDKILGAMQDNSNALWNGTFWDAWDWNQSDGTVGRFDPIQPQHVYLGWQYSLARNDEGGNKSSEGWKILFSGSIGNNDTLPFVVVFAIDPVKTSVIYTGSTTGLYKSTDRGDHWKRRVNASPLDGAVTAIAVSPKDRSLVWVGTSTGRIYLFNNAEGTVKDRTGTNMPNRWVSGIVASLVDKGRAFVSFSGYDANSLDVAHGGNGNAGKVFVTSDKGKHWTNVSGNLDGAHQMDFPIACLAVSPSSEGTLWLGTDAGVWRTIDGGQGWSSFRGTMPVVAALALEANPRTGYLTVGTFGRGAWRTPLAN